MGMPVATERYWTAEDVRQLPEDGSRYECVGGVLLVSPSPRQVHQAAVFELFHLLVDFVQENALGSLLGSPAAVGLTPDDIVQPDLFVLPLAGGAPMRAWTEVGRLVLAVEVVSPSTVRTDRGHKRTLYKEKGVPEYWIVDLGARSVERWRPDDSAPDTLDDTLAWRPAADVPPLVIDLPAYFDRVHGLAV